MTLIPPFWFVQRQGKAEANGTNSYRLIAPNLISATISIEQSANGLWAGSLRVGEEQTPTVTTDAVFSRPEEAWDAAFELYRLHVVV